MRIVPLVFLVACGSEHTVTQMCSHAGDGFDIEDVSTLEDAQGYSLMHDAVILEFDVTQVPEGATWRVKSVDILPMIANVDFNGFQDGQAISVEIWDADDPHGTPYVVTQTFDKDALAWEDVTLSNPTTAFYTSQKQAWWTFDFTDTLPTSGLTSGDYLVGVAWDVEGVPAVGYSNFNNSCDRNWTDYGDGAGWILNEGAYGDFECSWPMMRVQAEVLQEQAICNEDSEVVE